MARAATTSDVFNAIAEPRRRQIIELLAKGERSVNDVVGALKLAQPQASKHLAMLGKVGLVRVRKAGRQRFYRLNPEALKPVHDWVKSFERLWSERLDRLADYLRELQEKPNDGDQ
jgi:DNA-binding transcriptional ArsR family regulator